MRIMGIMRMIRILLFVLFKKPVPRKTNPRTMTLTSSDTTNERDRECRFFFFFPL